MPRFDAVLLDWAGTLVRYPRGTWRLRRALYSLGRSMPDGEFAATMQRLAAAFRSPEFGEAARFEDSSADHHRQANLMALEMAGLDPELREAFYATFSDLDGHPLYPDAITLLQELERRPVAVAIVSNVHFDIRPQFAAAGLDGAVDAYVLSYELGFQKPDHRMFQRALDDLGVAAERTLMVGDWWPSDGAATELGITTLLFARPPETGPRGLGAVVDLLG